jgi:hypothetical protein
MESKDNDVNNQDENKDYRLNDIDFDTEEGEGVDWADLYTEEQYNIWVAAAGKR